MNDLTISNIERQNVLNNRFAVEEAQKALNIEGMLFEGEYRFTKKMVADFYGVDISTIDRYLLTNADELKHNGYVLSRGKQLKDFKLQFGHLINEASKTTQLGLFNFRAFLNIGMLLTESERAKEVRSLILDIVITTINRRAGGGTKFINRRDANYLPAAIAEDRNDYPVQEYNIKDIPEIYFFPEYSKTTGGKIYDTGFRTSGLVQVQYFPVELCSEVIVDANVEFSPILLHILSHYYTTSPFGNSVAVTYRTNEAKLIYENKKAITKTEYYLKGTVDLNDCPSATNRPIPIPIK